MVTMGIEKYTSEKTTAFNQVLDNWENALLLAGKLLEENGDINHQYTLDMIEMVKNEGPYIVVTPGIALAHARPNGNVNRNSIAIVTSCKDIWFGHPSNDPVRIIIAVAAVDDLQHLKLFQSVAEQLMEIDNIEKLKNASCYEECGIKKGERMKREEFLRKIDKGLIVSCYAGPDLNEEMGYPEVMAAMAKSCVAGGAAAIRTNYLNIPKVKETVDTPLIGLKKVYKEGYDGDFRITPNLETVKELIDLGADAVAIDGTKRERYDDMTVEEFIRQIKKQFDVIVIADISTVEEGINCWNAGADLVGTTLSGYTPYSKNPIVFGALPTPEPDYEIIRELKAAGVENIIAEGRFDNGEKMKKAIEAGATAVVIGTAITMPKKIVKTILIDAGIAK